MADKKPSVMSPSDSRGQLDKNCGGAPPKMTFDQIAAENSPPNQTAKGSVTSMGNVGGSK